MTTIFTTIFAVVPSIVLLRYFYKRDLNPEPRGVLIRTFLLGVLIVVPVLIVAVPLSIRAPSGSHPLFFGFYLAFLCAAVPEEFFKFLVVIRYSSRRPAFDEPMDGVVYGAAASLGFATLENILYVTKGGWSTAVLRAFTAVPAHACFGAILGYYVGQARFNIRRKGCAWQGLMLAILMHGLYDLPVFALCGMLARESRITGSARMAFALAAWVMCLSVLLFQAVWVRRIVRNLRRAQVQEAEGPASTGGGP